jgi:zinc transport system permease protein
MIEALSLPFFQRALLAGLLASVACGIVGTFVVVKRMASISGGLSHAAFGGVGLGYLLGFDPMLGAAGFALAAGAGMGIAYRRVRSSLDTLIAVAWSVGMALGILFVSLTPGYAPDLMSYLFGSILFVPMSFVWVALALDVLIVGAVVVLFKEFRAVAFDEDFAQVMGVPVGPVLHLLLALISLAVVTLIRVVGVILVIALLTIPAAIARQWTSGLQRMMLLAIAIGAFCTTSGLFLAYALSDQMDLQIPTGPLVILIAVTLYAVSSALHGVRERRARGAAGTA